MDATPQSKVTAILGVVGGSSRVAAILRVIGENTFLPFPSDGLLSLLGPLALLGLLAFALHSPIFLKLPKISPSRMGHYGQSQTPGQGQDNGRYPTESKVAGITAATEVTMPFGPFRLVRPFRP